jgi:hypothetical protein
MIITVFHVDAEGSADTTTNFKVKIVPTHPLSEYSKVRLVSHAITLAGTYDASHFPILVKVKGIGTRNNYSTNTLGTYTTENIMAIINPVATTPSPDTYPWIKISNFVSLEMNILLEYYNGAGTVPCDASKVTKSMFQFEFA